MFSGHFFCPAYEVNPLAVELKKLWETENKANQIYNPTQKDDPYDGHETPEADGYIGVPRNILFVMSDPTDDKFKISLELDIQPASLREQFICGAMANGETMITGSHTPVPADASEPIEMEFHAPSFIESIDLMAGPDVNDNGQLDKEEAMPLVVYNDPENGAAKYAQIRGAGESRYNSAKNQTSDIIHGGWTPPQVPVPDWLAELFVKHARRFLQIFYENGTSGLTEAIPTDTDNISFNAFGGYFSDWLTHNAGANFDESGNANIKEYTWNYTTSAAEMVGKSPQIETALRDYYNNTVFPIAEIYFENLPVGSSAYFPLGGDNDYYPIIENQTVEFDTFWYDKLDDLNGTVGRGRVLFHKAKYKVEKKDTLFGDKLEVTSIRSEGEVIDLYDWNFETGGALQNAAILQLGYGNGSYGSSRERGKIYRVRIQFEIEYEELP